MSKKIVVRHSELADFRQCPLKHRLRWVDGWERPEASDPSRLGSAFHAVMQARYAEIHRQQRSLGYKWWSGAIAGRLAHQSPRALRTSIEQVTRLAIGTATDDFELDQEGADILEWMVSGYVEQYGVDPDWEVLFVETDLTVPFLEPSGSKSRRFFYQFHADLVVRDHSMGKLGRVLLVDHKTTKQLLGQDDVDLSDQFGLYCWALNQLGHHHPIPVCNQVRTARLKREMVSAERFLRINSFRTMIEMHNIAADALRTAKVAYGAANLAAPYSSPDPRQCGWKCDFVDTHLAIRKSKQGLSSAPAILVARGFVRAEKKSF